MTTQERLEKLIKIRNTKLEGYKYQPPFGPECPTEIKISKVINWIKEYKEKEGV